MAITKATASSIAPAAKGDLVAGSATNDAAVLGVGSNDQVLTADSSTATGLKWATPASGSTFVGAGVYSTSATSLSNGTQTAITWNSEEFDTDGFHSTSTNTSRMTIPAGKAGKYLITAIWGQDSGSSAGNQRLIQIRKNGTSIRQSDTDIQPYGTYSISSVVDAAVSDYFEIFAYQDSGSTFSTSTGISTANFFISYLGA
jgi:hypothetical protein